VCASRFRLGQWVIPEGTTLLLALSELHAHADAFPDPHRFVPERFIGQRLPSAWAPYGGGTRRCLGATFANMQMDVILRTILRHFVLQTTTAPDEQMRSRGVTFAPKVGAQVVIRRRVDLASG
jgi:cytochrome P450